MMIENEMLPEFIENLIEQINEDRLWQLYLAVALVTDKPFSEWKAEIGQRPEQDRAVTGSVSTAGIELSPEQAVAQAEGILAGFHPFEEE